MAETLYIKELNIDKINPTVNTFRSKGKGVKIVVIGKPGTGKSTLIAALLYSKKHLIPVAMALSGTEDSSGFYRKILPSIFVYNEYKEEYIEKFIQRQKLSMNYIANPWGALLVDDSTDNPAVLRRPVQQRLFKNGRWLPIFYVLALQYCMDVLPGIRTSIDWTFILREPNIKTRKSLYENYASVIPDFNTFCELMDQLTGDYTALCIQNTANENDWRKCVYWYKARPPPDGFKFGCPDYWNFHNQRFNPEYVDPIV